VQYKGGIRFLSVSAVGRGVLSTVPCLTHSTPTVLSSEVYMQGEKVDLVYSMGS
jgi:hypothetical protein